MKGRIINGVFWAVIAVALIVYCIIEWHKVDGRGESLAIMIGMYCSCLFAVWYTIDQSIKEYKQK